MNIWFQALIRGELFFSSFSFPVMIGDRIGFVGRREKSLWCQSRLMESYPVSQGRIRLDGGGGGGLEGGE